MWCERGVITQVAAPCDFLNKHNTSQETDLSEPLFPDVLFKNMFFPPYVSLSQSTIPRKIREPSLYACNMKEKELLKIPPPPETVYHH